MYCARRVPHSKMSIGHYLMVAILIVLIAIILCQLPHAIDVELDMSDASAQRNQAQSSN